MALTDWAILLQAASVSVAAISAFLGINAWRRQMIGQKRAEVAEKALTGFYEARDIIEGARSPASFEGEGRTRRRQEGETESDAGRRDALFAPAERLIAQREFFMSLNASRYRFAAYFGRQAEAHFIAIFDARNKVLLSARMLVTTDFREWSSVDDRNRAEALQARQRWERDIWAIGDEHDEIKRLVNGAVASIDAICRPVLEERGRPCWETFLIRISPAGASSNFAGRIMRCKQLPTILNIVGIIFTAIGVILMWRYVIPFRNRTNGESTLLLEANNQGAVHLEHLYDLRALAGLALIVIGAVLQIAAAFLNRPR